MASLESLAHHKHRQPYVLNIDCVTYREIITKDHLIIAPLCSSDIFRYLE